MIERMQQGRGAHRGHGLAERGPHARTWNSCTCGVVSCCGMAAAARSLRRPVFAVLMEPRGRVEEPVEGQCGGHAGARRGAEHRAVDTDVAAGPSRCTSPAPLRPCAGAVWCLASLPRLHTSTRINKRTADSIQSCAPRPANPRPPAVWQRPLHQRDACRAIAVSTVLPASCFYSSHSATTPLRSASLRGIAPCAGCPAGQLAAPRPVLAMALATMRTLETLGFDNRVPKCLRIDADTSNSPRPVRGASFARVEPTPLTNPSTVAVSRPALRLLDLDPAQVRPTTSCSQHRGWRGLGQCHCHCLCLPPDRQALPPAPASPPAGQARRAHSTTRIDPPLPSSCPHLAGRAPRVGPVPVGQPAAAGLRDPGALLLRLPVRLLQRPAGRRRRYLPGRGAGLGWGLLGAAGGCWGLLGLLGEVLVRRWLL